MDYLKQFLNPSIILLPTTALCIISLWLFLYHFLKRPNKTPQPSPPIAGGALPVIGHLHRLAGPEPAHKSLSLMADKHGPIFTIRMGIHRTLVVNNWKIAKECLTTNDKVFANRPKFLASETLTYDYAMFGLAPYGSYWRQIRKIAMLELLSNHRLETLRHVRESEVRAAINELFTSNRESSTEMKEWFNDITLNVVFRMVVGKRYLDATASESGGGDRCRKALRDFFEFMGSFIASDAIPWLRWLDLGGHEKAMKATMKELDGVAERWLHEHKIRKRDLMSGSREGDDIANHDFMDVLLSHLDVAELGKSCYDADTIVKATSMAIILAASDTTTITMTWVLALLLNNKEALRKVQQELDEQVGRERQVRESDIKNLVYLQAVVKETLRLYPAGPLALPHESMEDCTVAGYAIPARTRLLVNISKINRDPSAWTEPDEFKPERFLAGEGKNMDVRGQNFELIPFGSGRRMCPGVSFALHVTHLSLAALLQGFDIATPRDEPVDMRESAGLTNLKATPLHVLLTPRLPAEAY